MNPAHIKKVTSGPRFAMVKADKMGPPFVVMLGPVTAARGGIAAVITNLQTGGLERRWPVRYLSTYADGHRARKFAVAVSAWLRFTTLLLRGEVWAVHAHIASRASTWRKSVFLATAHIGRTPWILHLHGAEFRKFWEAECGPLKRTWIRFLFRRAAGVIALSPGIEHWIADTFGTSRTVVLPNPVVAMDLEASARTPANILFLGRLERRKGIYDLLAAVAMLSKSMPQVRLWCCGDGDMEAVRQMAASMDLQNRVRVTGWIGAAEKSRLLQQVGVFALPSHNEGVPMSMLEAMAAGLPVVVGAVGGIPDVVTDGIEGFLVPPGDVALLTERLGRLIHDGDLRCRMGQAGQRKVLKDFSLDRVMETLDRLYADLVPPRGLHG